MHGLAWKARIPLIVFVWLISPSFYWAWRQGAPVESTFLPPLSSGQSVLLAPYLIVEQIGYWLWPFGRENLVDSIPPAAVTRLGLFYWLILILIIRLCWRLRRTEPSLFAGLSLAAVLLLPFSSLNPAWVHAFATLPLCLAGLGLATFASGLAAQGVQAWREKPPRGRNAPILVNHLWRLAGVAVVFWLGALVINLGLIAGRTWEQRLETLAKSGDDDLIVAVEMARAMAHNGQIEPAESLILRTAQAAPWYAEIPMVKAEILLARDQPAAAIDYLQETLAANPRHRRAAALLHSTLPGGAADEPSPH